MYLVSPGSLRTVVVLAALAVLDHLLAGSNPLASVKPALAIPSISRGS